MFKIYLIRSDMLELNTDVQVYQAVSGIDHALLKAFGMIDALGTPWLRS